MSGPYKFTTRMTDTYTLGIEATPQMEAITKMYREMATGIDQELVRHMPNDTLIKLLSQLMEEFIDRGIYAASKA